MTDQKSRKKSKQSRIQSSGSQILFAEEMLVPANQTVRLDRDGLYNLGVIQKQPREVILRIIDCLKEI